MTWGPGSAPPSTITAACGASRASSRARWRSTQYDVHADGDGTAYGRRRPSLRAGVGTAGRLIPPTDYHVLANALADAASVTLHVYGGSLDGCRVFVPGADGRYREEARRLSYHE